MSPAARRWFTDFAGRLATQAGGRVGVLDRLPERRVGGATTRAACTREAEAGDTLWCKTQGEGLTHSRRKPNARSNGFPRYALGT